MHSDPRRPTLVADIGGSTARLALLHGGVPGRRIDLPVAAFPGPEPALQTFLAAHGRPPLAAAVLAVAAPVGRGPVVLTNAGWRFDRPRLARALGLATERLTLINDFHALALALPSLRPGESRRVGGGRARRGSARAVLGPGTGLGVAGLLPVGAGWQVITGEGGHVSLAPDDAREAEILAVARRRWPHVSAERLLSGSGLPELHRCCALVDGRPVRRRDTPALVAAALAGDAAAVATMTTFCAWLGGVAGDLALTFGAQGGVFVGGGIVPRLGDFFAASPFRRRFEAKGRFAPYLAAIPTRVILADAPALRGAACIAARREETADNEHADL